MKHGQIQSFNDNAKLIEQMNSIYDDTILYHNAIRAEMITLIEQKQISQEQVDNIIVVLQRYRTIAQNIRTLKQKLLSAPNYLCMEDIVTTLLDVTSDTLKLNILINHCW